MISALLTVKTVWIGKASLKNLEQRHERPGEANHKKFWSEGIQDRGRKRGPDDTFKELKEKQCD